MPETVPYASERNFTPTSTHVSPSSASTVSGTMFEPHSEHGQVTATDTPAVAAPTLPLSSVARALIVEDGLPWAFHV